MKAAKKSLAGDAMYSVAIGQEETLEAHAQISRNRSLP